LSRIRILGEPAAGGGLKGGSSLKVKIPTLSQKTRQGWGNRMEKQIPRAVRLRSE
jgi:hypothetical protein